MDPITFIRLSEQNLNQYASHLISTHGCIFYSISNSLPIGSKTNNKFHNNFEDCYWHYTDIERKLQSYFDKKYWRQSWVCMCIIIIVFWDVSQQLSVGCLSTLHNSQIWDDSWNKKHDSTALRTATCLAQMYWNALMNVGLEYRV